MSQIKAMVEDQISSVEDNFSPVEDKVSNLHLMVKRLLENQIQTAASEAKEPMGRTMNFDFRRRENDVEIIDEKRGRWGERCGNMEQGVKGAIWERKE
ncbi:hypothetical protein MA16_Dca027270 [Dendrobium catenatum]|uniref:Uncharacterized protein n=1 Tax=Dendrobium catenatum TaxID=906689 RepID=A0A2I0VSI0_9ASPA|nr:hypothetical protein MA16_Dca027270 [Dendrobium catenatum]